MSATPYACADTLAHLRLSLEHPVPVLLRYALYTVLVLAVVAGLLWLLWEVMAAIAELFAALLIVMAIAAMGSGAYG